MPKTTRATHKAQDDVLNAVADIHSGAESGTAYQLALSAIYSQLESKFGYEPGDFDPETAAKPPVVEPVKRATKAK